MKIKLTEKKLREMVRSVMVETLQIKKDYDEHDDPEKIGYNNYATDPWGDIRSGISGLMEDEIISLQQAQDIEAAIKDIVPEAANEFYGDDIP
jgi:hypothetical protein